MAEHDLEEVIEKTVRCTLTKVGFNMDDPIGCQQDLHFLRSLRHLAEAAGTKVIMVVVGVSTVAVLGGVCIALGRAIIAGL